MVDLRGKGVKKKVMTKKKNKDQREDSQQGL